MLVSQTNSLYLQIMVVFQKNLVYQTEKPTLSEINLLYLIIVTTACHSKFTLIKSKAFVMKIIFTDSSRSMMDRELVKMLVGNNIFDQEPIIHRENRLVLGLWVGPGKIKWVQATSNFQYQLWFPANGPWVSSLGTLIRVAHQNSLQVWKMWHVCMTYNYMLRMALLDRIRGWFYYVFIRGKDKRIESDLSKLSMIGDIPIRSSRKHFHSLTVTTFLPEKALKK